jgi:hypothetical protein
MARERGGRWCDDRPEVVQVVVVWGFVGGFPYGLPAGASPILSRP